MLALSIGLDHQVTMRLSSPAAAMLARPTTPSLTASQRVRVTLWVHARRKVPVSSSRATSGAPQKIPMSAGAAMTRSVDERPAERCIWLRTPLVAAEQSPCGSCMSADGRVVEVDEVRAGHRQDDGEDRQGRRRRPRPERGTGARRTGSSHDAQSGRGRARSGARGLAHVGEHEVLQRDRLDGPGRVEDRLGRCARGMCSACRCGSPR